MPKPAKRLLPDWVAGFMDYTSVITSPRIFLKWAAYSTLAGALERSVWTEIAGQRLYPNTIIILISPPGIGKSNAIKEVHKLWGSAGIFNVAPNSLTKAAFIDQILDKARNFNYQGHEYMTHPLLMAITEFGTLLPKYDIEFLNVLNQIFDCEEVPFADRTRKMGLITVDRAHLSLITGTQPAYLGEILPSTAYGMGFSSRTIMVYAGKKPKKKLFGKMAKKDEKLFAVLKADMKAISKLTGPFEWEKEAEDAVEAWEELEEDPTAPKHPRLRNYIPRRITHTCKLAMSVSVSKRSTMVVTLEDFQLARNLLLEAESLMPEVFKEMLVSADANELEEIHSFLFSYCRRHETDSVPEHRLMRFLGEKVPVNRADYFVKTLLSSELMKAEGMNIPGQRLFRPIPKKGLGE